MESAALDPDDLLESVVRITELRDRDNLGYSLTQTLHELIGVREVVLYRQLTDHAGHALLQPTAVAGGAPGGRPDLHECMGCLPLEQYPDHRRCVAEDIPLVLADGTRLYPVHGGSDSIIGLLEIDGRALAESDEHLIAGFLRIFRNYLAILDDSERDTLTGLLNRKTFDRNIARILSRQIREIPAIGPRPERRAAAGETRHWLAVMDVDHFKRINDRFGHLYGDEVLLLLARLMMETFRHHDRLYRFGGEEFVILLEPTDRTNAVKVLERFRAKVAAYPFPQVGQVTVSIGLACMTAQDAPSNVIGHADQALYHAKHHGRNQVCSYETLLEQGKLQATPLHGKAELF